MKWQQVVDVATEAEKVAFGMAPDDDQAGDPVGLARLLANLRFAREQIDAAAMYVENILTNAMETKEMEVKDVGVIERHTGASRKEWKREELMSSVAMAISCDTPTVVNAETGEMIDHVQLVTDILDQFYTAATPSWKVTGLRAMHIDPEQFCTTTWGRKTVQMPKLEKFLED